IDLDNPAEAQWQEVVPESAMVLSDASHVGGKLVVEYMEDVKTAVYLYNTDGTPFRQVALPGLGSASGFEGEADKNETFFAFASYNDPGSIYRYTEAGPGSQTRIGSRPRRVRIQFTAWSTGGRLTSQRSMRNLPGNSSSRKPSTIDRTPCPGNSSMAMPIRMTTTPSRFFRIRTRRRSSGCRAPHSSGWRCSCMK